jgi:hypothetical protein
MFNLDNNMNNNSLKSPIIIFGVMLSVALVLMSTIASTTMLKIKRDSNVISVTGSAKKDVVSDTGKLYISFSRPAKVSTLGITYNEMNKDSEKIITYLKSKGLTDGEIVINSVNAEDVWDQNERLRKDYTLRQSIEVMSPNVNLIDSVSKDITNLAQNGVILNVNASYTYSKLAEERVSLLSQAVDDAKLRAEAIASKSNKKINDIQSASSGVVQVLSPGSIEVQDYGSYDTSTINKTVMITTKVSFSLK